MTHRSNRSVDSDTLRQDATKHMSSLQTYAHDGGLFSFALPSQWSHVTEGDGTQVFWDDGAGSGTLRVTSLTATKKTSSAVAPQLSLLDSRASPILREDGVAWCHYSRTAGENGRPIAIYWWEFANFIPPCFARLAMFSFTAYESELSEPATAAQIKHLQSLVLNARFGPLRDYERASAARGA